MGHPDPDPYLKNRIRGSGSGKKWTGSATLIFSASFQSDFFSKNVLTQDANVEILNNGGRVSVGCNAHVLTTVTEIKDKVNLRRKPPS